MYKQTIHKYKLRHCGGTILILPGDFKILHVGAPAHFHGVGAGTFVWIQHSPIPDLKDGPVDDLDAHMINVFYRGDDWEWDSEDFRDHYIGTIQEQKFTWHYYYEFVTD